MRHKGRRGDFNLITNSGSGTEVHDESAEESWPPSSLYLPSPRLDRHSISGRVLFHLQANTLMKNYSYEGLITWNTISWVQFNMETRPSGMNNNTANANAVSATPRQPAWQPKYNTNRVSCHHYIGCTLKGGPKPDVISFCQGMFN